MSDSLDQFLRTTKAYYEEISHRLMPGKIGLDQLLFPNEDIDESANFSLDSMIVNPHGVSFRHRGEQSVVRPYTPGTGQIFEVPRASEKTPITETLRDSVVAGLESTAGASVANARRLANIITQHISAHNATRWKLALDVVRTGSFSPTGMNGNDIEVDIDFSRNASCSITYDFTAVEATIDTALKNLYDAYVDQGGPKQSLVMILGDSWLSELEGDSDVLDKMTANVANEVIALNRAPEMLKNCKDLYLVGSYRIPGTVAPVFICSYKPDHQWVAYSGATAAEFMPDDEAVVFSMSSARYRVIRGVDVLDDNERYQRAAGDIVFDSYTEKDPVQTYLRSQARYVFVPGNVDHTARSTGTFSES